MAESIAKLKRQGYSNELIRTAQLTREANIKAGAPARTLAEVLAGQPARPRSTAAPEDLTPRQLRRHGSYGQAAVLAEMAALTEKDPDRAEKARYHASGLKALAHKPDQLEFDYFRGGNMSIGHQFIDTIQDRLLETKATPAERHAAIATLMFIIRHLGWQDYTCTKIAAELADRLGVKPQDMKDSLALLESVRAIKRVKRGRTKVITVTPEGAFRGDVNRHAEVVNRYKAEVVQLHPVPAA